MYNRASGNKLGVGYHAAKSAVKLAVKPVSLPIFALLLTTSLLPSPAQANDAVCEQISDLAALVMMARQEGLSATEMLQMSSRVLEGYGDGYHHLVGVMIGDAFRVPRYVDPHYKQVEIAEFSNQYFKGCQQSYRHR